MIFFWGRCMKKTKHDIKWCKDYGKKHQLSTDDASKEIVDLTEETRKLEKAKDSRKIMENFYKTEGHHGGIISKKGSKNEDKSYKKQSFRGIQASLTSQDRLHGKGGRKGPGDSFSFLDMDMPYTHYALQLWPVNRRIPFCFHNPANPALGVWTPARMNTVLDGMNIIEAGTQINFDWLINCDQAGHKLRFDLVTGGAWSYVGVVNAVPAPAHYFPARLTPADVSATPGAPPSLAANTFQPLGFDSNAHYNNPQTVAHELMHTLGFSHMHQRSDVAAYAQVTNVADVNNCAVRAGLTIGTYHYESIMHYPHGPHQCGVINAVAGVNQAVHGNPGNMGNPPPAGGAAWALHPVDTYAINTLYP